MQLVLSSESAKVFIIALIIETQYITKKTFLWLLQGLTSCDRKISLVRNSVKHTERQARTVFPEREWDFLKCFNQIQKYVVAVRVFLPF